MINSTFGGFMTARLGMSVSQQALNVVGQNISNVGTVGYTRQRLDQVSLNVGGGSNRYSSQYLINIGNGALATGVSQVRDQFLDRRYRNEMAQVGQYDIRTSGLQEVADILDEANKVNDDGGINNQLGDFLSKLNDLSQHVGDKEFDGMVKASADSLVKLFNSYAKNLQQVRENTENDFQNVDVEKVNSILNSITELNKSIKSGQIQGDNALELQDQRNLLLDELSTYVKIDVQYDKVAITEDLSVDELTIYMVGANGKTALLSDDETRQFEASQDAATGKWSLNLTALNATNGEIKNIDQDWLVSGSLKSSMELLNCSGEFDAPTVPNSPKGLGYYEKMLDSLANQFATVMNKANNPTNIQPPDAPNLFATNDNSATITAANIKIADGWANNSYGVTASKYPTAPEGTNDNILHMMTLMNQSMTYYANAKNPDNQNPTDPNATKIFDGSFQEFFTNIGLTLGMEIDSNSEILNNHVTLAGSVSDQIQNVSGVSLDEEGMNMLQYSKAYTASARMMTALDEALDTLINKMGVVGR